MKNRIINVQNVPISISKQELDNYICITDIAKAKTGESRSADVVKNWLRNRNTLEFLGTWEMIYNPDFKVVEFEHFKSEAGLHTFVLSVAEWINKTNAIGLYVKRGKYGGTYAHKDIAFEFASAISPVFKLYLIKEFQRLKENKSRPIEWNAKRFLTKNNYLIQTDAVKNYLLPQKDYKENLQWLAYAEEADILNVALFGFTAKAWRETNPGLAKKNNVRDFATINELTVLSNLESHNAQMKYIQTFLSVLKFKHLIGAFVSQFLSCIGIDMTHHKVNLFLRVLSDIFSFWNNPAYHLMVVFATAFLIGGTGIAVEHPCAKLSLGIAFDSGRIGKFASVISQQKWEQFHEDVGPEFQIEAVENINDRLGIISFPEKSKL